MVRRLAGLVLAAILAMAVLAQAARADDAGDVKQVISSQLQAFRDRDGPRAYSFAAPAIKVIFPSPDVFMTMVESGYPPVFDSRTAIFGAPQKEGAGFREEVYLTDRDGGSWIASYTLERQKDGSMKITGVTIRKGTGLTA